MAWDSRYSTINVRVGGINRCLLRGEVASLFKGGREVPIEAQTRLPRHRGSK